MMQLQICLSDRPGQLLRWQEAFPSGRIIDREDQLDKWMAAEVMLWLHLDCLGEEELSQICNRLLDKHPAGKIIALSSLPNPGTALSCLKLGIVGYCHALAAPGYFQQVGKAVSNGGYWLGEVLVQRLVGTLERQLQPGQSNGHGNPMDKLSQREQQVASQVRQGAANKEIATTLAITERTVKAHLSSIFQKLEIRDRLQLVLLLQNRP